MTKPVVSIVIVNLNGAAFLSSCLSSVAKLARNPSFEVILVDNGSADRSKRLIERFSQNKRLSVNAIFNKANIGFCGANNQGARVARGEFLLFLNNDTEVPENLLAILVAKLRQDTTIGIIQPKILLKNEPGHLDSVGGFLTWTGFLNHAGIHEVDKSQYDQEFMVFSPKGACMMIRKNLFGRVGGFDEDFFAYFEETDLAWRVWLVGKKVLYYPAISIDHLMGRTTRQLNFEFIQFHSFKNRLATLLKNLGFLSLWRLVVHLLIVILLGLVYTLTGQVKSAKPIFKAIWWNITHLGSTLKKRAAIQGSRRVNDAFLKKVSKPLPIAKVIHDVIWFTHQ